MFANDSYVITPPACIEKKQRICLEAVSFSMRAIMFALEGVRAAVRTHGVGDETAKMTEDDRVRLFSDLWVIVDQLHALRLLLKVMRAEALAPSFLDRYAVARDIRNAMDHPAARLASFASMKKSTHPYFGSLSYFVYRGARAGGVHWGEVYILPLGSFIHETHSFQTVSVQLDHTVSINEPDLFEFSAFGFSLPIFRLFSDLPELASALEKCVRSSVEAYAKSHPELTLKEIRAGTPRLDIKLAVDLSL